MPFTPPLKSGTSTTGDGSSPLLVVGAGLAGSSGSSLVECRHFVELWFTSFPNKFTSNNGDLSRTANVWKLEVISPISDQESLLSDLRVRANTRAFTPCGRLKQVEYG